ncbi:MAG: cadmium-translocating P-type ATPase [Betaproteobacteria bacterium]|nr:cadmium-translocating P-type ATPase [Betaproteobacteria bacterium]
MSAREAGAQSASPATASAVPACFHCGLAVAEAGRWRAPILGSERQFCCAGCEAVARTIAAGGFAKYYETREPPRAGGAPALPAAGLPPAEIYDETQAQGYFVATVGAHRRSATLILDRIRCAACLWLNEQWLRRLPGLLRVDVNYATRRAQVEWDERATKLSRIIEAIRAIGYDAFPFDPQRQASLDQGERRTALWRLFVAGFGAMQVMMYAIPAYLDDGGSLSPDVAQLMRWASFALTLPVLVFSAQTFFAAAWRDLMHRRIGLDTPIAIGLGVGFAASGWATVTASGEVYFDSISMLVFLLLGARYAEMIARQRAARGLDRLARWMPCYARRLKGEMTERIPAHALAAGDRVIVPAGEQIPADGVVEQGASSADESLLTGESMPVAKSAGMPVVGGSVNIEQPLVLRVTKAGSDTVAAAIVRLVERAAAAKPRVVAGAEHLARWLTWVVLAVAAVAALWWSQLAPERALWVAVAILVVTCPCALALAAPIALTAAAARLLDRGVAMTRAGALEALARATDVVLDKTGTLTMGRLALVRTVTLGRLDRHRCIALARALEESSAHPIARALCRDVADDDDAVTRISAGDVTNFPGHGIEANFAGRRVRIGSESFCRELAGAGALPSSGADSSQTTVFLADEAGWLAAFMLEDEPRHGALSVVAALRQSGIELHLVSGDDPRLVESLARRFGIERFAGRAAPQDKFTYVERLQAEGRVVAMVGDGLNDAPVLARADVSFAMAGGSDVAQLQSDFVLLGERLRSIPEAVADARRTLRVIRQNFGWALAYNAIALPLAAAGWVGPWEAAIGMAASSFIVVLNALRLAAPADRREWKASTSSFLSQSRSYS